jgi:predicted nucleic acid-binding protein
MKFWDSSAIVPLFLKEASSDSVGRVVRSDEDIMVWWGTRLECLSALARRRREKILSADDEYKAKMVLLTLDAVWSEILPSERVRKRAERLLGIHALRAADALQLASALIWAEEDPQGLEIVCLDQNLREAASREGFTVLP